MRCTQAWAEGEFGRAQLGDRRRTARLVHLAAEVAQRPTGTVTGACRTGAAREGAFRWLESSAVIADDVVAAAAAAGAGRCVGYRRVVVAVDATSLSLTEHPRGRGLGAVGSLRQGRRGVHAMTALAIAPDGTTLGLCGQKYWSRTQRSKSSGRRRRRVDEGTETRLWTDVLQMARGHLAAADAECEPWFQIDRGGDCWDVLAAASRDRMLLTVRATHDRRLDDDAGHLWQVLEEAPVRATRQIALAAQPPKRKRQRIGKRRYRHWTAPPQPARRASLDIRAAAVSLQLRNCSSHRAGPTAFNAVLVRERGRRSDRIEWLLLTTHPIATRRDLLAILDAYALRWRVEEFHKTWKSGLCRVEDTQLRSASAVFKWATILASVATRAMTLSRAARSMPDVPATEHLTPRELQAIFALRQPKGADPNVVPSLAQAVRWIADLGGYVGPWNGPAGPKVIGRGLYDVLVAARALEARDKMR
jgi:Transposase DNA-binding/Transposase DDE domain